MKKHGGADGGPVYNSMTMIGDVQVAGEDYYA